MSGNQQQVIAPLTAQERAALEIAFHLKDTGRSLIRMNNDNSTSGPAIESLVKRGYLEAVNGDMFNCVITDAGCRAFQNAEQQADRDVMNSFNAIGSKIMAIENHLRQQAEQAAVMVARMAIEAKQLRGEDINYLVDTWIERIARRAKDIASGDLQRLEDQR